MMPQLYWEIGHNAACSETLIYWWNEHANNRPLYIGQDVKRTMDAADLNTSRSQLARKIQLSRYLDNVSGNCFWPASTLIENYGGVASFLYSEFHRASGPDPGLRLYRRQSAERGIFIESYVDLGRLSAALETEKNQG